MLRGLHHRISSPTSSSVVSYSTKETFAAISSIVFSSRKCSGPVSSSTASPPSSGVPSSAATEATSAPSSLLSSSSSAPVLPAAGSPAPPPSGAAVPRPPSPSPPSMSAAETAAAGAVGAAKLKLQLQQRQLKLALDQQQFWERQQQAAERRKKMFQMMLNNEWEGKSGQKAGGPTCPGKVGKRRPSPKNLAYAAKIAAAAAAAEAAAAAAGKSSTSATATGAEKVATANDASGANTIDLDAEVATATAGVVPASFSRVSNKKKRRPKSSTKIASSYVPPPLTEEEKRIVSQAADILSVMPTAVSAFEKMHPDARRYIVVAAASEDWFGGRHVQRELEIAEQDDERISASDFDQWLAHSMKKRMSAIPRRHFWTLVVFFGAPFFAMGMLDNCVFILAGDFFDDYLRRHFGLAGMLCAGLAGIVSGMIGLQVHGVARKLVMRFMKMPDTSPAQRASTGFTRAKQVGGCLGLSCGLAAGLCPLLLPFIGDGAARENAPLDEPPMEKEKKAISKQ